MTVFAALRVSMSSDSARPAVVSGRTAIAGTRKLDPSGPVTVGGPAYVIATSALPLGSRYWSPTWSAIWAERRSTLPVGSHADQAGAGAGLPRPTRTSSEPTPAPATTASRT